MPCVRPYRFHHPRHHPFYMMGPRGCHEGQGFAEALAGLHDLPPLANKAMMSESDEAFLIRMDMPGVKAHQVTIEEKDGEVEIVAIRMDATGTEVSKTYQEILYVDPIKADLSLAQANLNEGVLTLTVPKKVIAQDIEVKVWSTYPPADAAGANEFRVSEDLPGVKAGRVSVQVSNDRMTVRGERPIGSETMEMRRVFEVPRGADMTQARAFLVDGVFTSVAPKLDIASSPLRTIFVSDVPNVEALRIDDGDSKDEGGNKNDGDQVMVETVQEKEWEHVVDAKPSTKNQE